MVAEGKSGLMAGYWWLSVFPGLCILLILLAVSSVGDWFWVPSNPPLKHLQTCHWQMNALHCHCKPRRVDGSTFSTTVTKATQTWPLVASHRVL